MSPRFPSADKAPLQPNPLCPEPPLPVTLLPCCARPVPVSLPPCCVQVEPVRVNTQAAPTWLLSPPPPMRAVFPSADSATPTPNPPAPVSPVPVSLPPCCVQVEPVRVNTQAAPTLLL